MILILLFAVGQVSEDNTAPSSAAPTADVMEAQLAAFRGQASIVMHAGGCSVVCGESTVPTSIAPAGAIDLISTTFAAHNPSAMTETGTMIGKVTFDTLNVVKALDTATPALLRRLASGPAIPTVVISFYAPATTTAAPQSFLKYTLTNVLVGGYTIDDTAAHTETLSLSFTQVRIDYFPAATGGKVSTIPQSFCWDTTMARPC